MQLTELDFMGDMSALAPKREGTDELIEAAGQHAGIPFSIEQICDGTWSIGGKSMSTLTSRLPAKGE